MTFQRFVIHVIALVIIGLYPLAVSAKLIVKGVNNTLEKNILAHVAISREACDAPSWRLQQRRRDINKEASKALQAYGYYEPQFTQSFSQKDKCWQLELQVTPGPQVTLRTIDIQLIDSPEALYPELQTVINNPLLRTGAPLNHQSYDTYKQKIMDTAQAWGYWQSVFKKAELAIYPNEQAADVYLHFSPGPRYTFGAYAFSSTVLKPRLIERLAEPLEGRPYSADNIQDSYNRLQNSNYFRQVVIAPQVSEDKDNTVVPLSVNFTMNNQRSLGAGIGYSTDQGPRIRGDFRNRYYNSDGHKLRGDALWSDKVKSVSATYTIPREDAALEWYEFNAGFIDETTTTYHSIKQSTNARVISALPNDWIMNTGINLMQERYRLGSEPEKKTTLYIPGIGFYWTSAEETSRQTRGINLDVGITGSHQVWLSDLDYVQTYIRSKSIVSPMRRIRIISRVELGATLIDNFDSLPVSVRYFAGGDNSVRGYEYKSLGDINAEGDVIGGGRLAVGSIETDYLFLPNWSASLFYDIGDAYDEQPSFKTSWGTGLRWFSPLGAFRLDVAFPHDSNDEYRIHLSVGADL